MKKEKGQNGFENLPGCAADYIRLVIKKMRWKKKVRGDVQAELIAHFEDTLHECKTNEEKEKTAKELIANFGDAKMLAVLARRAKKRCRPTWQKVLIRTAQITGIFIVFIILRVLTLSIGSPTISVNYVDALNEQVRAGRDESLNAKPFYDKAGQVVVEMPEWLQEIRTDWPGDFNQTQLAEFTDWLDKNNEVFELLRQGAAKEAYWNVYGPNDANVQDVFQNLTKQLGRYRRIAQNALWEIRYNTYKGNLDAVTTNAIALTKFGHNMEGQGTLIEQLVGIAIEALGVSVVSESISRADFPEKNLEEIQSFLERFVDDPVVNIETEKNFIYDVVQRSFTDDGKGNGRMLLRRRSMGIPLTVNNWKEMLKDFFITGFPDRQQTIEQINSFFKDNQQRFDKTPPELKNEPIDEDKYPNAFLNPLNYSGDKLIEISWRIKTHRGGIAAILAVLRYHKQTGKYPDSLEELVNKGFMAKIPFDAYRNGPMTYRKTKDSFTIYSYAKDFDDANGTPSRWGDEPKGGDHVFWPVKRFWQKSEGNSK